MKFLTWLMSALAEDAKFQVFLFSLNELRICVDETKMLAEPSGRQLEIDEGKLFESLKRVLVDVSLETARVRLKT